MDLEQVVAQQCMTLGEMRQTIDRLTEEMNALHMVDDQIVRLRELFEDVLAELGLDPRPVSLTTAIPPVLPALRAFAECLAE